MNRDSSVFRGPKEGRFPGVGKEVLGCPDGMEDDAPWAKHGREAASNFSEQDISDAM